MAISQAPVGSKFANLTVVGLADPAKNRFARWVCKCDCGIEKTFYASNVKRGLSKSCGCMKAEAIRKARTTHGHSRNSDSPPSPTYTTWSSMMTRCYNKNSNAYSYYGGRGITVCDTWKNFEGFLADMGTKPVKGMSIERLDTNGNYEPNNCVWANHTQQARNTRHTKLNAPLVERIRAGEITTREVMQQTGCAKSTVHMANRGHNWGVL